MRCEDFFVSLAFLYDLKQHTIAESLSLAHFLFVYVKGVSRDFQPSFLHQMSMTPLAQKLMLTLPPYICLTIVKLGYSNLRTLSTVKIFDPVC
jgi:hypothetical protein